MALTTIFKRLPKILVGVNPKQVSITTKIGSRAKNVLQGLSGSTKTAKASSTASEAVSSSKARKALGTPTNIEGQSVKSAFGSKIGAGLGTGTKYGAIVGIPLALGGYGMTKLGEGVSGIRQGIKGPTMEDVEMTKLETIQDMMKQGLNPAEQGLTEQGLGGRKNAGDSPLVIFAGQQPQPEKPSAGSQISKVLVVGGLVAGAVILVNAISKGKIMKK